MRDLKTDPAWSGADLGFPLPDSPHACLVSLPTWESVIGYEENRPEVVDRMRAGYPRFFIHPVTQKLFAELHRRLAREGERVVAYSSAAAAGRANDYVKKRTGAGGRVEELEGMAALIVPEASCGAARDYWKHTGELVCSRQAEDFLEGRLAERGNLRAVRQAMAVVMGVAPEDCFLFESGMAAIFTLHRVVTGRSAGRRTLQLCFPYVDALKVQEQFGCGVDFVRCEDAEEIGRALERVAAGEYAAVFCEVPSNPLLRTIDLPAVSRACREAGTPLLVDDTICSHYNIDVLPYADAVSTSLTKWVSGIGDVLAGSVKVNRASSIATELRAALETETPDGVRLYPRDAEVLVGNARGFERRVAGSNERGEVVAEMLARHSSVARVWYPKLVDRENYDVLRTAPGGYGGLMSFTLARPDRAPAVYVALRFSKGPSLGTEYSLLCPYTLLAHYNELDWAAQCGVARELLRFSAGLEPVEEIVARLEEGLVVA